MDATNAANIIAPYTASKETYTAKPYYDVNGYATGYGNHYYQDGTPVAQGDAAISQPDAYALMVYYLQQGAAGIAAELTTEIEDYQLAALTDLIYRVGSIPQVIANINAGADAASIAAEIQLYNKVNGAVDPGAQARANDEAAIYMGGNVPAMDPVYFGIAAGVVLLLLLFK